MFSCTRKISREPFGKWQRDTATFHPTQKPVELATRAILNSSDPGDIILDLFGGSGFTLIGAEMTERQARLVELSPTYCDGIVRRYVSYTGNAGVTCTRDGKEYAYVQLNEENIKANMPDPEETPEAAEDINVPWQRVTPERAAAMAVLLCFGERREQHMAAKRDAPELWGSRRARSRSITKKFCQYRDMPYGTQGREPEKRSIRRLADAMGMKSKSSIEKLSTQWNWVERAAAYDVYMTELERFKNEQEIKKMHDLHAKLGVQLLNKATRGLIALPDNELSAQDIARLADVGGR